MTMLLSNHHNFQYPRVHQAHSLNYSTPAPSSPSPSTPSMIDFVGTTMPQCQQPMKSSPAQIPNRIADALEIARDSPDGCPDPSISSTLETALAQIWSNIQAQPDTYVMSRDEFAVFNFFQHRYVGNKLAVAARKRYWDNAVGA